MGGLYADFDMEIIKPMEPVLQRKHLVFGLMDGEDQYLPDHNIPNAIMFSVPGHPFWLVHLRESIHNTCKCIRGDCPKVEAFAGPVALRKIIDLWEAFWADGNTKTLQSGFDDIYVQKRCPSLVPLMNRLNYTGEARAWRERFYGNPNVKDLSIEKPGTFYPCSWKAPKTWPDVCQGSSLKYSPTKCWQRVVKPWSYSITYWTHSWA